MSLPNSIFSATRKEAIAHASGGKCSIDGFFEFGGITDLDLSNLFAIATGKEFDFDLHELSPLEESLPDLFQLPSRFIDALAQKKKSDIPALAAQWSETEELDCDANDLVPVLDALISLSKARGNNGVYFTQMS